MSGALIDSWPWLVGDVWEQLATYASEEVVAPDDLFSSLFRAAADYLSPAPTSTDLEEARNDPVRARDRFLALRGTDFENEAAVASFLVDVDAMIAGYDLPPLLVHYRSLIGASLEKFNLRYGLEDPFELRALLPGSFGNLYDELARSNVRSAELQILWDDFETAFDRYVRTQRDFDLRTSIQKTSNYLEGLAVFTRGRRGTLGQLCDGLKDWPHDRVKEAVKILYSFASDYSGIRHGSDGSTKHRTLDSRDSVAINVALLALATYLTTDLDGQAILGIGASGRPIGRAIPRPPDQLLRPVDAQRGLLRRLAGRILPRRQRDTESAQPPR